MSNVPHNKTSFYDALVQQSGLSTTHQYLLSQVSPGATVLELGPASGYMTQVLTAEGCTVDAIEIDPCDAERAAPHCRRMIVGSLEDPASLSELPGPYDIVLMADVLEHLRAPERILPVIRGKLAADGLALASLPNIAFWRMRLALLLGRFDYTDTGLLDRTHLRFFTLATATAMFTKAGFRVAKVIAPPVTVPRFGQLKQSLKDNLPKLFSYNFVFHLNADGN
jgi:2-polyprenyl-3-methyl-5-hydroxy-6-metoxy-1,4-benzoquinol methylase